ncbi:4-alpha-glucanotransferase [Arthrobacter sp. NPDC057013]|uniref:4-alpha-glucanotransferase n=1 Tax=Arthrobacter sp. NPDC057013 TaxID=3345999 RepID=UPI00363A3ACA
MKVPSQQHATSHEVSSPATPSQESSSPKTSASNGKPVATAAVNPEMLRWLAEAYGVGTSYQGWDGQPHEVAADTLIRVLAALGVNAQTDQLIEHELAEAELAPWRRMLPPAVVIQDGTPGQVTVHVRHGSPVRMWAVTEDGRELEAVQEDVWVEPREVDGVLTGRATFAVPQNTGLGWHTLRAEAAGLVAEATLVVTPARLSTAADLEQRRGWGLATQLYSVRSKRSWGVGDFADLAELTAVAGARGADYVLVNPLHAADPVPPLEPSPYSPSTRRFFNPLYLRIESIPELAYLKPKKQSLVHSLMKQARKLNKDATRLNRDKVYSAKLAALELIAGVRRSPSRQLAFEDYCRKAGAGLDDFALWCAIREDLDADDPFWSDPAAALNSPLAEKLRGELAERIEFYRWLQWLCDEQLESAQQAARNAGMRLGVVNDLAVGVDLQSSDAWTLRGVLAPGVSVGAPPDMYNQLGQDWHQPPWHPTRLAEAGYKPFREMLATVLRHSGGIRVDHILGFFRLWWVPEGNSPADGAYVRFDHDAMIGILALEAHRAGAVVIGEDLGTFEPWVRDYLAARGILGTSILWFENDGDSPLPPEKYRLQALSSVNTHDLPPTAGYLAGDHVTLRNALGLLERSAEEERLEHNAKLEKMMDLLRQRGLLSSSDAGSEQERIEALHRLLAQTPSVLLGVALVDAVGERRVQNQPGTTSAQYPNWQVPLANSDGDSVLIDSLEGDDRFNSLLAAVEAAMRA